MNAVTFLVSAVFIWSYIKRLFSARDGSAKKEHMGHVRGGYKTVFDRLTALIAQQGGSIRLGVEVQQVSAGPGGGMRVRVDGNVESFDKVIFTGPVNVLRQVADTALVAMARITSQSNPMESPERAAVVKT